MLGLRRKGSRRPKSRRAKATSRPRTKATTGASGASSGGTSDGMARARARRARACPSCSSPSSWGCRSSTRPVRSARGSAGRCAAAFGKISYLVPVATLVISVAAFVRREEAGRILVGSTLITFASSGVAHLASGTSPLTGGWDGLAEGGGAFGALVAVPLNTYIGAWAGALACIFAGLPRDVHRHEDAAAPRGADDVALLLGGRDLDREAHLRRVPLAVDARGGAREARRRARTDPRRRGAPDDEPDDIDEPLTSDVYETIEFEDVKATGPIPIGPPPPPVDARQGRSTSTCRQRRVNAASRWANYQLPPPTIFRRSDGKAKSAAAPRRSDASSSARCRTSASTRPSRR